MNYCFTGQNSNTELWRMQTFAADLPDKGPKPHVWYPAPVNIRWCSSTRPSSSRSTHLVCVPKLLWDAHRLKKCCGQQPNSCISMLPHFDVYILQEEVLQLARRIWNDVRAVEDLPNPGESNKQFRHAAYRQYVVWQYGALGAGHRVVIPSCCVWKIRDRYPDPQGQYKGFIPSRV